MVTIFSKNNCPQCEMSKRDMDILGIDYIEVNIDDDPEVQSILVSEGYRQMPVLKTKQDQWQGYDREKIKSLVNY